MALEGITIKTSDIKPEFRRQAETEKKADSSLYNTFNTWGNNIHTGADKEAAEAALQYTDPMLGDEMYEKNFFEIYNHTYRETAYIDENTFNLGQDKKITTEEELFKLYEEIAKGQIAAYDTDDDKKISLDEMISKELADYNALVTNEADKLTIFDPGVKDAFSAGHAFFDLNGDGYIDTDETKAYYATMDALYDENGMDGKIKYGAYHTMNEISTQNPEFDKNASDLKSTIIQAYNKYFK